MNYENTQTKEIIVDNAGGWVVEKVTTISYSLTPIADYKEQLATKKARGQAMIVEADTRKTEVESKEQL